MAESGATAAALAAVAVLGIVVCSVFQHGASALSLDFLIKGAPTGIGPAIVGTALIVSLGDLDRDAVGVLVALYVTEFAGDRAARSIRLTMDLMNGLPSIIIGLFVFGVLGRSPTTVGLRSLDRAGDHHVAADRPRQSGDPPARPQQPARSG